MAERCRERAGLVSSREADIASLCVSFACQLKAGLSVGTPDGPGPADRGHALPCRRAAEPRAGHAGPAGGAAAEVPGRAEIPPRRGLCARFRVAAALVAPGF